MIASHGALESTYGPKSGPQRIYQERRVPL